MDTELETLHQQLEAYKIRLDACEARFRNVIERNADGIIIVDQQGIVRFANPAAEHVFARQATRLLGTRFGFPLVSGETTEIDILRQEQAPVIVEMRVVNTEWEGEAGYLASLRDITKRKQGESRLQTMLHEKEVLLKELHHRVKNNLQVISTLLDLQLSKVSNPEAIELLQESQNRINALTLVYGSIYTAKDLSSIDVAEYIHDLAVAIVQTYKTSFSDVMLHVDADNVFIAADLIVPCGLILNELISNACKHGETEQGSHDIQITFSETEKHYTFIVRNRGKAFPDTIDLDTTESLGLGLVRDLAVHQLDGSIHLDKHGGATFTITFPKT